jgi:hypothetical protein
MSSRTFGDGPGTRVRGLRIWRNLNESTFISTKAPDLTAHLDVVITETYPHEMAAKILVSVGGDAKDIAGLGLVTGSRYHHIGFNHPMDIGAGILVGIGIRDDSPGVTATGISLVINADRETWDIERDDAFLKRMLALRPTGILPKSNK